MAGLFKKKGKVFFSISILLTSILVAASSVTWAWTEPVVTPPQNNVLPPITISSVGQYKTGQLGVASDGFDSNYGLTVGSIFNRLGIKVTGDSFFQGSNSDSSKAAMSVINSSGISLLYARNDGTVGVGTDSPNQTLSVGGSFGIRERGINPLYYSVFVGGDQTENLTYVLPVTAGASGTVLTNDGTGTLSWKPAGGGTGGSMVDASYVVMGLNDQLDSERVLVAGSGLTMFDAGANGNITLNIGPGTGISVDIDTVGLTNPIKACPAGQAIQSFDLGISDAPTCIPAGGGTGSLPAGTLNQTLRHDGSTWTASSFLINTDSRVGIGRTNPGTTLDVAGDVRAYGGSLYAWETTTGKNHRFIIGMDTTNSLAVINATYGSAAYPISIQTGGGDRMRITPGGQVGIGTTSPDTNYRLTLSGGGIKSETPLNQPAGYFSNSSGVSGALALMTNTGSVLFNDYKTCNLETDSTGRMICGVDDTSTGAANAFRHIANSAGLVQFSATGEDTLRVAAASGLTVSFNSSSKMFTYAPDFTIIQERITASCPAGSSIRQINEDGSIVCETDDVGSGGELTWPLRGPDDSAAVPDYSFSSSPRMGMFRIGPDMLGFSTNGTQRMIIDNEGRIGIATGVETSSQFSVLAPSNRAAITASTASTTLPAAYFLSLNPSGIALQTGQGRVRFSSLANCNTIDTDSNGYLSCGTDEVGSSGLPAGSSGDTLRHDGTSWVANSFLYNNGSRIGIGTSSPVARLDIRSDSSFVQPLLYLAPGRVINVIIARAYDNSKDVFVLGGSGTMVLSPVSGAGFSMNVREGSFYVDNAGSSSFGSTSLDSNYRLTIIGSTAKGGIKSETGLSSQPAGYLSNTGGGLALWTASGGVRFGSLTSCSSIKTDASGNLSCGTSGASNAFANIANSTGAIQFSASGEDTLRMVAGSALNIGYNSSLKLVSYSLNTSGIATCTSATNHKIIWNGNALVCAPDQAGSSVSITAGAGLVTSPSPITDTGSVSINTTSISSCTDTTASKIVWDAANNRLTCASDQGAGSISGTTNYVTKFTSANSVGDSIIYNNGRDIGIGGNLGGGVPPIDPNYMLTLTGDASNGGIKVENDFWGRPAAYFGNSSGYSLMTGSGGVQFGSLAGTGDRMVFAGSSGTLRAQTVPSTSCASGYAINSFDLVNGTAANCLQVALPPGTNNYTLRYNGTAWESTSSIYNTGIQVGIGTTNLGSGRRLTVSSNLGAKTVAFFQHTADAAEIIVSGEGGDNMAYSAYLLSRNLSRNNEWGFIYKTSGDAGIYYTSNSWGNSVSSLFFRPNGYVGLGGFAETDAADPGTGIVNVLTIKQGKGRALADGWSSWSSIRFKENVEPIDNALAKVLALEGVYFDWKETGERDMGLIAEEVGKVIPEVVTYEANGIDAQSVDYGKLSALLIQSTKELNQKVEQADKTLPEKLKSTLASWGVSVKETWIEITAKKVRVEKLEMVDQATGEVWCTWIENGQMQKQKGSCQ